ncbi:MAG: hypothetical protein WCO53_10000 [Deltaproteobacteria bacterium]
MRDRLIGISIFTGMTIAVLFIAYYTINNVTLYIDESYYIMAAKKAMSGEIPYRDFGYAQAPIMPYINGFFLNIFGFTQQASRVINMCWGYLAILFSMIFVLKRRGLWACFICGWVLLSSPLWVGVNCFSTYGLTNFLMTVTGIVFCSSLKYDKKVILFSIFGSLAIGCRLTVAPAIMILWAFLILEGNDYRQKMKTFFIFIAVELTILLPFFIASPYNFIHWNVGYHISTTIHRRIFSEHFLGQPSVFIMLSLAIPLAFILKKKFTSPEVALLLAAIAGIFSQFIPQSSYFIYSMLFSTMAVMGGTIILSDFKYKKYICAILLIFPLIYLTPSNPHSYLTYPPINAYFDNKWNDTRNEAVKFLKKNTSSDDLLLTHYPILAIEADRDIFHGMEMGWFAVTDEMDQTTAKKLNYMHYNELIKIVRYSEAKAIILRTDPAYPNFFCHAQALHL